VFLGWAFGGETLTGRMLVAAAVIVTGVIIITTRRTSGASASLQPISRVVAPCATPPK
jgi:drug/metabolite transporter (DMT)-like permease